MANILVVDDSSVMRKNLCMIFEENGHKVIGEAADGRQAIILYSELKPDLVTMDITMPNMNGVDAVEAIIKKHKDAKIIMVSALNQKQMVFEAIKNGAKNYVIKPIDSKKFTAIINEVLNANDEEKASTVKEKEQNISGFNIENANGSFIIAFNEHFGLKDQNGLDTAIKGMLFIKPLKIVFDFGTLQKLSELSTQILLNNGKLIINSGGELKLKANSCEIINALEEIRG
jgi:YesN/AraC family two-component response regulator